MNKLKNIKEIVSQMTLEEKAKLVNGATFFGSYAIERLGIPRLQLLDGGTGINFEQMFGDMTQVFNYSEENMIGSSALVNVIDSYYEPDRLKEEYKPLYKWIKDKLDRRMLDNIDTTDYAPGCFPPGILLGATWDRETVRKVGQALGIEACIFGVHMLLGTPNVNIHRDPLNGRLFEGYSEDPYLVSALAPELVKGVQEYGVIANVKHFAANNQETNRVGINETISKRALEEIYLPGFKACVTEGRVKTVMSAYNKINGVPCTESTWLLGEKLRGEWGFDGFVVSDWGAVSNPVKALLGGNDLVMPGPHEWETVYNAVKSGIIPEEAMDNAAANILSVIEWLSDNYREDISGYISEHPLFEDGHTDVVSQIKAFTDDVAYNAAARGIVMLKNSGVYPLKQGKKIILCGSGAGRLMECGAGSAGINTDRVGNLSRELKNYYGEEAVFVASDTDEIVKMVKALAGTQDSCNDNNDITAKEKILKDIAIIVVCSLGGMEGNDRKDLKLAKEDLELISHCPYNKSVILNTCGPVDMSFDDDNIEAIWAMFLPGMGGAKAMADIISGKVNPSGKLPLTFPESYEDTPTYLNFPGDGWSVNYGEGIYVGYRYYDKKKVKPKYPFGYGLSYTSFDYRITKALPEYEQNPEYNTPSFKAVNVSVRVTNTGMAAGAEVIQLYISDVYSTIAKPVKELKNFAKVYLEPGESKEVTFVLDKMAFSSYDSDLDMWITEEGYYDIHIASSSQDVNCRTESIYIKTKSPYSYGINSQIKVIYENEELKKLAYDMWSDFGFDVEMLNNNYQYTSHRTLKEILDDVSIDMADESIKQEFASQFESSVISIEKK